MAETEAIERVRLRKTLALGPAARAGMGGTSAGGGEATRSATAGGLIPSELFPALERQAGPLTLHWELFLSHWRAPQTWGAERSYTQIGGLGVWRHSLGGPESPWFADVGVGASLLDGTYATANRRFSTAFQFTEVLGLGYRFGANRAYELSLRFQHFSNGGIKKPNPGENFVRVRLAAQF
jgi:lipid A 3-O-deacylase